MQGARNRRWNRWHVPCFTESMDFKKALTLSLRVDGIEYEVDGLLVTSHGSSDRWSIDSVTTGGQAIPVAHFLEFVADAHGYSCSNRIRQAARYIGRMLYQQEAFRDDGLARLANVFDTGLN